MQKVICYIFGKLVGNFSYISYIYFPAAVVELVDTLDLKSNGYLNGRAGSSPARGTQPCITKKYVIQGFFVVE